LVFLDYIRNRAEWRYAAKATITDICHDS
jgi:hypothetical protein